MIKLCSVVLVLSVLLSVHPASAQQAKFGHINSAELLSMMPESKTADAELKKFGETLESQLKSMHAEYQSKVAEYQSKESLMAESIKQTRQKDILDLENRIQEFQEQGQSDIQKKKEELYSPILKKAQDAINSVANENGYTYIFDASLGTLLFAQPTNDVMPMVKKKLSLPMTLTPDAGEKKNDAPKTPDKKPEAPKK